MCKDTGWYGDNGAGIKGNREYLPCECDPALRAQRKLSKKQFYQNRVERNNFGK